tara:strand:- start:739 stop:1149 length:411 start_codon:yes stop_codon:yes gene_type:complete
MMFKTLAIVLNLCIAGFTGTLIVTDWDQVMVEDDWIATPADNICGIKNPKQVSNPGVISWQQAMDETKEMKKIKRENIDKTSALGITLIEAATRKTRNACQKVMNTENLDSVWKNISHVRKTPMDITHKVIDILKK